MSDKEWDDTCSSDLYMERSGQLEHIDGKLDLDQVRVLRTWVSGADFPEKMIMLYNDWTTGWETVSAERVALVREADFIKMIREIQSLRTKLKTAEEALVHIRGLRQV